MSKSLLKPAVNDNTKGKLTNRQKGQQKYSIYYNRIAKSLLPLFKGDVVHYKKEASGNQQLAIGIVNIIHR